MTLESGLLKGVKIYHKIQQHIYLIYLYQTLLPIIDFLIVLCFSVTIGVAKKIDHIWNR